MTTNQTVDSSFTAIIKAPIDKIDIPTWLPPIVSTLMDIRLPFGDQLSLQSIMRKFELGLPNESQQNLSRASHNTALHQNRPFHNLALRLRIMQLSGAPPRPPLDRYLKPSSGNEPGRPCVNRGPMRRRFA
jgi:hypothetical protein